MRSIGNWGNGSLSVRDGRRGGGRGGGMGGVIRKDGTNGIQDGDLHQRGRCKICTICIG